MIRRELREDRCVCGRSLGDVTAVDREPVVYTAGEFAGEPGVAVIASCRCGLTTVVPYSVDLGRAA